MMDGNVVSLLTAMPSALISLCFIHPLLFFSLTSWYESYDSFVTKNDHKVHLQEEHHISAAVGLVEFCYWCQEWWVFRWKFRPCSLSHNRFQSEEDWYEHCQGHIITWYLPHKLPNAMPPSIPYPGYNTQISTGLVTKPGICPFCLWDASQPADIRLNQWEPLLNSNTTTDFVTRRYGAANLEIHIRKSHYPVLLCSHKLINITVLPMHAQILFLRVNVSPY